MPPHLLPARISENGCSPVVETDGGFVGRIRFCMSTEITCGGRSKHQGVDNHQPKYPGREIRPRRILSVSSAPRVKSLLR